MMDADATRGRYREIALIGQGGMATVKLAALAGPLGIQKLLVVKEALPHLSSDPEFVAMFMDEARLASRFNHPNLIQTYEVGSTGGRYFLVMEYLDGQPLSAVVSRLEHKVPVPIAVCVLSRVLAGLHYAHELTDVGGAPLGVVHRDVSPQNVFVCYDGAIKLADFGIAKVEGAAVKTRAGTFKGKLAYASPEQLLGEPVDRRTDVFAVGVILWEALTGQRLTKGLDERVVTQRRLLGDEPKVKSLAPDADGELVAICEKAMALRPDDRFATAAEMQQRLDEVLASSRAHVRDADVGALVAGAFDEERSRLRSIIKDRLAQPAGESGAFPTLQLRAPASSPSEVDASLAGFPASPTATVTSVETRDLPVTGAQTRRRRTRAATLSLVGLAAVALVGVVIARTRSPAPTQDPATARQPSQVARSAVTATPAPSAVASPGEVEVFLAAIPESATLSFDGDRLGTNPYRARRPKDEANHTVMVSAPGYVPERRTLTLARDVHVELSLRPAAPEPHAAPVPAPAPPAVRQTGRVAPGARPIDSTDPYGARP